MLNGADNFQSFLLQTGTPITEADAAANFLFAAGDFNRDGIADLICLEKTSAGTGKLEVHVLNGADNFQSFLLQTGTPITEADAAANFLFAAGDFNRDGIADLICLKKTSTGTGKLEVHVLNGADNFQSFLLQTGTPITEADAAANFLFAAGDFNRDGIADLICLKKTSTGTGKLEVHVLNGADNFQSFLLQTGTPITEADAAANFLFAAGDFNRGGKSFSVIPVPPPSISSFSPESGQAGSSVVISGQALLETTSVQFGGRPAAFTAESDVTLMATVPGDAKTGKITVVTRYGTATSNKVFTVTVPSPAIDSFQASPAVIQLCQPTRISLSWKVRNSTHISISRDGSQIISQDNPQGLSSWSGQATDVQPESDDVRYTIVAFSPAGQTSSSVSVTAGSAFPVIRAILLTNITYSSTVSVWFYDGNDRPIKSVVPSLAPNQTAEIDIPNCQVVNVKAMDKDNFGETFARWESRLILGNDKKGAVIQQWFS